MEETKEILIPTAQTEKPTYEQLEREVAGLRSMNNQLFIQNKQMNMSNLFKRIDYLFKVVGLKEAFNPDFVTMCTEEIEGYLTLPETTDSPEEDK